MFQQNIFCERIRSLRISCNLSQQQLGEILGISKPAVSDIERGRRTTTIEKLVEIAEQFNVSTDYLLGLSDNPTRR